MADNTKISDEGGRWDRTMEERLAILVMIIYIIHKIIHHWVQCQEARAAHIPMSLVNDHRHLTIQHYAKWQIIQKFLMKEDAGIVRWKNG
jgi:hypothetical protein